MKPVEATDEQLAHWRARDGVECQPAVIGGPDEAPDVVPCPAIISAVVIDVDGEPKVGALHHVAYKLDEIELAHLAKGGTLWLSTWGGLPIHHLEVEPADGFPALEDS